MYLLGDVEGLTGFAVGGGGGVPVNHNLYGGSCLARSVGGHVKRDGIKTYLAAVAVIVAHDYNRRGVARVNAHHGGIDGVAGHTRSEVFALYAQGIRAVRQFFGISEHVVRVDADVVAVLVCDSSRTEGAPCAVVEHLGCHQYALLCADVVLKLIHRQALLPASDFKSGGG